MGCGPSPGPFQCMLRAVISSSPNFYILDEPTNHLDMETIEALAKALNKFRVRFPQQDVPFFQCFLQPPAPVTWYHCQRWVVKYQ